jgi:hypothetical protein
MMNLENTVFIFWFLVVLMYVRHAATRPMFEEMAKLMPTMHVSYNQVRQEALEEDPATRAGSFEAIPMGDGVHLTGGTAWEYCRTAPDGTAGRTTTYGEGAALSPIFELRPLSSVSPAGKEATLGLYFSGGPSAPSDEDASLRLLEWRQLAVQWVAGYHQASEAAEKAVSQVASTLTNGAEEPRAMRLAAHGVVSASSAQPLSGLEEQSQPPKADSGALVDTGGSTISLSKVAGGGSRKRTKEEIVAHRIAVAKELFAHHRIKDKAPPLPPNHQPTGARPRVLSPSNTLRKRTGGQYWTVQRRDEPEPEVSPGLLRGTMRVAQPPSGDRPAPANRHGRGALEAAAQAVSAVPQQHRPHHQPVTGHYDGVPRAASVGHLVVESCARRFDL